MPISGPVTQKNHSQLAPVCVIGAGSAGLTALKALKEAGFDPIAFEMGTEVGGLWAIDNENGRGGAYETLHINTSTQAMQFSDFPMKTDIGDFPSHQHIAAYFASFATHFGLLDHIQFNKEVVKCSPHESGYHVTVVDRKSGESTEYDFSAVVVANGHHFAPAFPPKHTFSSYEGTILHSAAYRSPESPHDFSQERVLVVGMGNSAMDIACELSRYETRHVSVAARRGAWVLPKYILGKPLDQGRFFPMWLPSKLRRRLVTKSFVWLHGKMSSHGLPEPDHLIGEAHPTVSTEFPERVSGGHIEMRKGFASAAEKTVTFSDGSTGDYDAIVFCTGYDVTFPFFDEDHISAPENRLPLFHRVFHLQHRRVFFVGLAQTVGAIMPVAETQARLIAEHLKGDYNLPDSSEMETIVARREAEMERRFVKSRRHSMQVIPEIFQREVTRDLKRGYRRAKRGTGIPFPGFSAARPR